MFLFLPCSLVSSKIRDNFQKHKNTLKNSLITIIPFFIHIHENPKTLAKKYIKKNIYSGVTINQNNNETRRIQQSKMSAWYVNPRSTQHKKKVFENKKSLIF